MSVKDIETANRYFKYDFCQGNNVNGLRFQIPPLVENQYSTHYKACLAKIKYVGIQTGSESKPVDFTDLTNANVLPRGGVKVETNLISRNYASMGDGDNTTIVGQSEKVNNVNQRFGCVMNLDGNDAISATQGTFVYHDYSDVFGSGMICSLPFGQVLEFKFFEACGGDRKEIFPCLAGATTASGFSTFTIEFFLIN
tara:strand:- start:453 stop:1043 length:591 start_codon:yes stop_codon:yes gene_type:complete